MIVSFKHKGLQHFFENGTKKGINPKLAPRLKRLLDRLHAAEDVQDMQFPGSGLHLLKPTQDGIWSLNVSGNWRLTFRFDRGKAFDIDYLDYH